MRSQRSSLPRSRSRCRGPAATETADAARSPASRVFWVTVSRGGSVHVVRNDARSVGISPPSASRRGPLCHVLIVSASSRRRCVALISARSCRPRWRAAFDRADRCRVRRAVATCRTHRGYAALPDASSGAAAGVCGDADNMCGCESIVEWSRYRSWTTPVLLARQFCNNNARSPPEPPPPPPRHIRFTPIALSVSNLPCSRGSKSRSAVWAIPSRTSDQVLSYATGSCSACQPQGICDPRPNCSRLPAFSLRAREVGPGPRAGLVGAAGAPIRCRPAAGRRSSKRTKFAGRVQRLSTLVAQDHLNPGLRLLPRIRDRVRVTDGDLRFGS